MPFVKPPTGRELSFFLLISIFIGGLNFGLVFVGLMNAPASVTGIANQLWTPLTLLLAWPLLGERPSLRAILGVAIAFGGVAVAVVDPTVAVPGKYRCSMVAMLLSYCPQHGAPVSRPIVPPTGIASYGKFEFGISMAPTVQNCSTSACFERVALGRLLQGLCGSRFTAVCGDSPGLTRHGSQSALVFANDQPWTKPIQRTFWKIR